MGEFCPFFVLSLCFRLADSLSLGYDGVATSASFLFAMCARAELATLVSLGAMGLQSEPVQNLLQPCTVFVALLCV
jgi:hypothetical protein